MGYEDDWKSDNDDYEDDYDDDYDDDDYDLDNIDVNFINRQCRQDAHQACQDAPESKMTDWEAETPIGHHYDDMTDGADY
jgi:hypothetical protein